MSKYISRISGIISCGSGSVEAVSRRTCVKNRKNKVSADLLYTNVRIHTHARAGGCMLTDTRGRACTRTHFLFLFTFYFFQLYCPSGFLPWENRFVFHGERQLRQSRATQPTAHAGCFSVSITHQTRTWNTGSLTSAQMLMHAIAHGFVRTHVRESASKVDSGRKIPRRTGESNLRHRRDGMML